MKQNRLQELWNDVTPEKGPCPQPDAKKVQRRVDAALDGTRRTFRLQRTLKLAALCAAALVLLTGAAAVVTEAVLPEYNVFSVFFPGSTASWDHMVTTQPVSVSDDNYTMTLTSAVADKGQLFYTFTVQAHSDEAFDALLNYDNSYYDLWSFRPSTSLSMNGDGTDPETRTWYLAVAAQRYWGNHASVRLNLMDEGVWLKFPYTVVSDLALNINADGPAKNDRIPDPVEGTVTLKRLTLSPLTIYAEYITEDTYLFPVVHFLWEDGTYSEVELGATGTGSGHGTKDGKMDFTYSHSYRSVQDLSELKAVVFNGMAYPVDHGQPYEVDLSTLTLRETES